MNSSFFTVAFLVWGILLCALLTALELLWLRGASGMFASRRAFLFLTVVNVAFAVGALGLLASFGGASFVLFVFPVPILPVGFVLLKMWAYGKLRACSVGESALPHRRPRLLAFCTLFFHPFAASFAWEACSEFNPTRSNLESAIREGATARLRAMLWLSVKFEPEMTALVNEAILNRKLEAARVLLRHGADPRQEYWLNKADRPMLWLLVKWMLEQGVPLKELNLSQAPVLAEIVAGGTVADLQYCLEKGFQPAKDFYVAHAAIEAQTAGDGLDPNAVLLEKLRLLHAHGADLNAGDHYHFNPLFTLMRRKVDRVSVLTFLLEHGADVNVRSVNEMYPARGPAIPRGITPLMLAALDHHSSYVDILLASGADRSLRDSLGRTALDYAVLSGDGEELQRKLTPEPH